MNLDRWDAGLERLILALVAGALSFAVLAFGGVRVQEFLVVELLVALAAGLWLVRVWLIRSHRLLWPPVCWGVLAFAGWAVWRTAEADLPYVAWGELLRILTYTTLFFVVLNNLHRQDTALFLTWCLATLATLLCFYGAWQYATADNTVWGFARAENYVRRASGSYACPNHFAGFLELLLPVALALVIAGRVKPLGRILLGYAVLAMAAGIFLTFSRGGWLAAGCGLAFVLLALARNRDYRWPALVGLLVLLVGGGALAVRTQFMQQRLRAAADLNTGERNTRINIWRAAVAMWKDHPWLGVGPAHFNERFKQYRTFWAHGEPERAHNDYLDALADWGVAGAGLAAIPWFLLAYGIVRTLRQVRRDSGDLEVRRSGRYALVLGATGGFVALGVHSLTDFNLHIPANALVTVTLMGFVAGYSRYATDDWWVSSRRPWRFALTLLVAALLAGLGWDLARRGRETLHLLQALKAPEASDARIDALKAAWAIEPRNPWTAFHLGEAHRLRSFTGAQGYQAAAEEALGWFRRAAGLHPFHPAFPLRAGMCLDWLDRHDEAAREFQTAHRLDPEGRITSFHLGWHELQKGNDAAAREWFVTATRQGWPPYEPALRYLEILDRRAREQPLPRP
jgi:O-antigen ligase